jgi:high affinity sulfate transporter 1
MVPITQWLPRYQWRHTLPADLIAGIAVAALLIPESMGYAGVAGVPAQVGLYAALAATFAYAVTGGTSILVVGPASAVAALSASIVAGLSSDADPVVVTSALALASGVLLVTAGLLRLGWVVNFISRPVLHAFVAGLSISIIIGQLSGLFGVEVEGESAVSKLIDTFRNIGRWDPVTVVVGVASIVVLLLLGRFAKKVPGALVVVVVGILLVVAIDLDSLGVAIVGEIPRGLPEVGVPLLSGSVWFDVLTGGMALVLVGYSEGYASASAIAAHTGKDVDADQELVGSGTANIASGLVGGLAVSGSLSKSSASQEAGARSQVSNLVAGFVVLATLLFLAPVFEKLPEPVLSAVVIAAVLTSSDPRRVSDLWSVNRLDFVAGLVTFVLVLVWETLPAMIVGVVLSLAFVVHRASFPDVREVRRDPAGAFRAVTGRDDDPPPPDGVAVLRFEAPLIYANAERFGRAALRLVEERPGMSRLVVDAEMLADLDASGAEQLENLDDELSERGISLHLAQVHRRARAQMERSSLGPRFAGRTHRTLSEAVNIQS